MVHFDHFGQILPPGHAQILPKSAQNPGYGNNFVKNDQIWLKLSGNDHFMITRSNMVHFDHFGQILPAGHVQILPNW